MVLKLTLYCSVCMAMSIPTIAYSLDPSINPIESSYRPRLRYIIKTVA